ncbi:MAG: LL-diaminopimelate aminotransferase [Phycisphaerae bacterium]
MSFTPADRLNQLPPYLFIEIDRKKREALEAGRDVIDFGVGDPDRPTPGFIVERMADAIRDPENHPYPLGAGSDAFRTAAAEFLAGRFGVEVDPSAEVLALIGSKEGLAHLPLAVINPGETALIPTPGYPVYEAATCFAGGVPHRMPLAAGHGFLPVLEDLPAAILDRTALMFVNYPNNPTAATASLGFYERCVALAKRHRFVICSDAAYTELYFDDADRPHSILEVEGAKDVCVELHSLSKTFNMTGWRVAFAAGNAAVLRALAKIKGNVDSGVFGAIQQTAVTALRGAERPEIRAIRECYRARRDLLVPGLRKLGFEVETPRATFYVWARCPGGRDAMTCATKLLDEAAIVAIPGVGFGRAGEGYLRFALTVDRPRIREALGRLTECAW